VPKGDKPQIEMREDMPSEILLKTEKHTLVAEGARPRQIRVNARGWEDATPTRCSRCGRTASSLMC